MRSRNPKHVDGQVTLGEAMELHIVFASEPFHIQQHLLNALCTDFPTTVRRRGSTSAMPLWAAVAAKERRTP